MVLQHLQLVFSTCYVSQKQDIWKSPHMLIWPSPWLRRRAGDDDANGLVSPSLPKISVVSVNDAIVGQQVPGNRWRFEMLLNPGEDADEMCKPENVKKLLEEQCKVRTPPVCVKVFPSPLPFHCMVRSQICLKS